MTSPITGFQSATPVETTTYWYLQISGTDQGVSIGQVLEAAAAAGLTSFGSSELNGTSWRLHLTLSDGHETDCYAGIGDYIVVGTNTQGALTSIGFCNGPSGTYQNTAFSDRFTSSS